MVLNVIPPSPLPQWRFWLPLCLQVALILTVPARAAYTLLSGRTAILQTIPVDPYDLLRGYSQTLRYDISRPETLRPLPGWDTLRTPVKGVSPSDSPITEPFFVILEAPPSPAAEGQPQQPWKAIAVSRNRPEKLPDNRVAIQGRMSGYTWIDYGVEAYYFPEEQRQEISEAIDEALSRSQEKPSFLVEVKVDGWGNAVPVSLWVGNRRYQF